MLDQEDDATRIGVWTALGVVFFVLAGLLGGIVLRHIHGGGAARGQVAMAPGGAHVHTSGAVAGAAAGSLATRFEWLDIALGGDELARVHFGVDQAELPADAAASVQMALKALADNPAARVLLSGFHDASGDPAHNAELAMKRAVSVREALIAGGAEAARIQLRKPASTMGTGTPEEARRVELRLVR